MKVRSLPAAHQLDLQKRIEQRPCRERRFAHSRAIEKVGLPGHDALWSGWLEERDAEIRKKRL